MIYYAIGRRELGKTTFVVYMAQRVAHRVILDPRGLCAPTADGIRVTRRDTLDTAFDAMAEGRLSEVIITPDGKVQPLFDRASQHVMAWAKDFPSRRLIFVVDEARFVDLEASDAFEWITRTSPRDVIDVAITAHRPSDVPTSVRAIVDHWILFRCTQEHDLKVIRERCGDVVAAKVATLDKHQFVHWNDGKAVAKPFLNPKAWYVPLHRDTPPEAANVMPDNDAREISFDSGKLPL